MATWAQHINCRGLRLLRLITLFAVCIAFAPTLAHFRPPLDSSPLNCSSFDLANITRFAQDHKNVSYSNISAVHDGMSLTLFPQLYFDLRSDSSFTFSYTLISSHSQIPPSLVLFILYSSLPPSTVAPDSNSISLIGLELCFTCVSQGKGALAHPLSPPCKASPIHIPDPTARLAALTEAEAEPDIYRDELRLNYDTQTGELHAEVDQYQDDQKITIKVDVTDKNIPFELIVGYITDSNATNLIATTIDHKSHNTRLVWIIVGTILGASLVVMGLTILVLLIQKPNRKHPSLPRSRGFTTQAEPRKHDPEASEVPMMGGFPLTPPHYGAFQELSGTASWLKQPITPR